MFRDKNDSLGAYSKPQSTTWPLVLQDTDYTAKLDVSNPPLKRGKQHLKLRFETGAALAHLSPVVKITMPMGKKQHGSPGHPDENRHNPGNTTFKRTSPWRGIGKFG